MLDLPLGFLSLAALCCFHYSIRDGMLRPGWAAVGALATVAAGWTKFQAVCICLAAAG